MRLKDITILGPQYSGKAISGDVSFVPMECLRNGNIDAQEISFNEAKGKYTFFADGDLLMAKVTPCFENGNIAIAKDLKGNIGFGSSEIFVLRMKKQVLNSYMFYVTQASPFKNGACATMCGVGGLKRISPLFMRDFEMNTPSMPIQQKITDYLSKKTADIDTQIDVLSKKKLKYEKLKESIIYHSISSGIGNLSSNTNSLWTKRRLKSICTQISRGCAPDYVDASSYYVVNQATFSKGFLDLSNIRYTRTHISYANLQSGDLLIASTGGGVLGKVYYFDSDDKHFYADSHVTILRDDTKKNNMKFLYYYFLIRFNEINAKLSKGSTNQTELQRDSLMNYEIPMPSTDEQNRIISYLDNECTKIDSAIENIDKQIEKYIELKKSLINEVITGKRVI